MGNAWWKRAPLCAALTNPNLYRGLLLPSLRSLLTVFPFLFTYLLSVALFRALPAVAADNGFAAS
jgi:hypothetical protein